MAVPRHLDEAATRLEEAARRIERVRSASPNLENLREWLDAVTSYVEALSEVHRFTNESIHEKLHHLAGRLREERALQTPP